MNISWNWLKRHIDLDGLDPHEVGDDFTLKVAELEGIHHIGGGLDAMRTVLVKGVENHPDSDHLSLVTVADGEKSQTVVCGASNARDAVGKVCVLAPEGCTLPDGFEVGLATIRGVQSAGMLLSEKEMGLSDDHGGITVFEPDTAHGVSLTQAVPIEDWVFEIDNKAITHRPDLWGHAGIAREIGLLVGRPLRSEIPEVTFGTDERIRVVVENPELCPRYLCTYFTNVTIGPSPLWLQCLLRAAGVRPISNVVDLTNFVMLDVGNPIHAFDARFVRGNTLIVRTASEPSGEVVTTLDGQERQCSEETLLICDAEGPVAIAGVMGGANSEIREDTVEVVLEAANFNAGNVRRTSTRIGLRTDSSARFEKALDPAFADHAARLFTSMMLTVVDGCQVTSPLIDVAAPSKSVLTIDLDPDAVSERLGVKVPIGRVRQILMGLGFSVQDRSGGFLKVAVPSWRATKDVAIPEDLIEEIGRIHGYQNIPPSAPRVDVKPPQLSASKNQERLARQYLSDTCGMHESVSYAFTWKPILEKLGADLSGRLELANPISAELDLMRRSLVPNLLSAAVKNTRFFHDFALYEIGRTFVPVDGELPVQDRFVGCVAVDSGTNKRDDSEERFRGMKGIAVGLLQRLGAPEPTFKRPEETDLSLQAAWIHPSRSVSVWLGDTCIGYLGLMHPRACQVLDLTSGVALAEINLDAVLKSDLIEPRYAPIPRYPGVQYDVSFEVAQSVTADQLEESIRSGCDTDLLQACELFANYHLDDQKKSVSFHLSFRSDKGSLTDTEVKPVVDGMVDHVCNALDAKLRGG
jgi:phenylalanyl-tRNA synthetase beta chain